MNIGIPQFIKNNSLMGIKKPFKFKFLSELIEQSKYPPGGDPVLGSFYKAMAEMIVEHPDFADLIEDVKKVRPSITTKHLANLLFRAYQYIKFEENDLLYRAYKFSTMWREELELFLANPKTVEEFKKILIEKSTTTTIYQRYAGPYAIISQIYAQNPVLVADLGCGGNYGLKGIELHEKFKPINDHSPSKQISKLLNTQINLKGGLAMDKEDPDDPEVTNWRTACSFYPKELDGLNALSNFENRIKKSKKVQFIKVNLLDFNYLPKKLIDVVILSTILYQLHKSEQLKLLQRAKSMLKPGGILIVQDFATLDKNNLHLLNFKEPWFGKKINYRTFLASAKTQWNFLELLLWDNGRCNEVFPGRDFLNIFTTI